MSIMDAFPEEMNKTATVYAYTSTRDSSGHVIKSYSTTAKGTVKGFLYQSSASNRVINDKYRPEIDALFITDPLNISFTFDDKDKLKIDSKFYEILYSENIGNQGEVIQIGLKKYEG